MFICFQAWLKPVSLFGNWRVKIELDEMVAIAVDLFPFSALLYNQVTLYLSL